MVARSYAFDLAHQLLGQDPAEFINEHRTRGLSWDRIAKEIWVATNRRVDINGVTVKAWTENGAEVA